jgi:hypothetical protein
MSTFTPEQQAELEAKLASVEMRVLNAAKDAAAQYAKADSAWQKLRREHPLAVQNVAIGLLVISLIVNAVQYFRPLVS